MRVGPLFSVYVGIALSLVYGCYCSSMYTWALTSYLPNAFFSMLIHQRPVLLIEGCIGFLLYMTDLFPHIRPPSPPSCICILLPFSIRPTSAVFLIYGVDQFLPYTPVTTFLLPESLSILRKRNRRLSI
jgi:hypothetical protein